MAKKEEEKVLNQTKGTFRLIGKITGTERDNFFTSRILERGKMKGKEMRSLRFGVKTSNQQTVYVQMTGYEPETVYLWNTKEKDKAKRSSKMSYDDYLDQKEILEEDGIITLDSTVGLTEAGKDAPRVHDTKFDNVALAEELLENGMTVMISGTLGRGEYEKNGTVVQTQNFDVQSILLYDRELDFDNPNFKESAYFTEEFVLFDTDYQKGDEHITVTGKTINYAQKTFPVSYTLSWEKDLNNPFVNYESMSDEEKAKADKEIDAQVKMKQGMASAFKKVKFGSLLKIEGNIINRAVVVEEEAEEDDLLAQMRGNARKVTNYISLLSIEGTDSHESAKYTEDDFMKALEQSELVTSDAKKDDEEEDDLGGLRGKGKSVSKKFDEEAFGSDPMEDIDDSDLPF